MILMVILYDFMIFYGYTWILYRIFKIIVLYVQELKQKLQRLETQKRAALDSENYAKAAEIKKSLEADGMACDGWAFSEFDPNNGGTTTIKPMIQYLWFRGYTS